MMRKTVIIDNIMPEVGMGATIAIGSDRHAATIIQVLQHGKKIVVQEDIATRTDKNGMSECQTYTYEPNLNGSVSIATKRKDGRYRIVGGKTPITVGYRNKYYDFSF